MDQTATNDLSSARRDLRVAYRLVYAFQRRTNEIAAQVSKGLTGAGLEFQRWDPVFYSRPCRSSSAYWSDHWTWDLLRGFALGLMFETPRAVEGLHKRILVQFLADTGFEKRGGEPDPAQFTAVEETASVVRCRVLRAPATIPPYGGVQPYIDAAGDEAEDGGEHRLVGEGYDFANRYFELDLVELASASDVRERLVLVLLEHLRAPYPSGQPGPEP